MPETPETTPTQPDPETEPEIEPETEEDLPPNPPLAAIICCRDAYNEAFDDCCKRDGGPGRASEYLCEKAGAKAYRDNLPPLSSRQQILNFIACVAEGVLMEVIPDNASGKLIYAAQVALGALPRQPKKRKKAKKHTPPLPRDVKKVNRDEPQLTPSQQAA
jgi:hypothetical protein